MGESVVPRQRKRAVGRLRLLFTALVATTISVVGAVGTASAAPDPTGTLEICKVASGQGVTGTFNFTIQGRPGTVEVPVGGCSMAITLPVGTATVTEVARPGFSVEAIATDPAGRLVQKDPAARTARVSIVAGGVSNQTIVTFSNKTTPKGFLEVCKDKPARDSLTGNFNFTVSQVGIPTRTVTVPVGHCGPALQLFAGTATITEVERTGSQLLGMATTPSNRLVDVDVANRTATVRIVAGDLTTQTLVRFTNKNAPPPPTTGLVKICKHAGTGVARGTTFSFTLATRATRSVDVKAGFCSLPQRVPVGNLTVAEKATNGLQVSDISVDPESALVGDPDLTAGSVTVDVKAVTGDEVTEVHFTNRTAPPGTVKICKVAGNGVVPRTPFNFTAGTTPVTVLAGYCSLPLTLPAGNLTVTEAAADGVRVTDITVVGAGSLVTRDLDARKVTFSVASRQVTEVVFTNSKPSTPVRGCVKPMKHWWKDRRVIEDLVPHGGLTVGGGRLSASQTRAMLRMAQRGGNFRFELQGELIAAVLNQLGGASTPTGVQAAINAAQLLMSQGGGSYHNGAMNTGKMSWWTPATFNGRDDRADDPPDTLGDYNEGASKGGPRWCHRGWGDGNPWDDGSPWGDDDKPDKHKKHHFKWFSNRFCRPL
jgi:hypothetical protein